MRRQVQIDVYNIEIERWLDREEEEEVYTNRCIPHITKDRQIVNREDEEVGTDRCTQLTTIYR